MTLEIRSRGTPAQQSAYEGTIRPLLATIRGTTTGQIVLGHLERTTHRVRIVPYGQTAFDRYGFNNAMANPMSIASGSYSSTRTGRGSGSEISFSVGDKPPCKDTMLGISWYFSTCSPHHSLP